MAFDLQPTLRGPLLLLRPLQSSDYEALYAAANDPLVWEQHPVKRYKPEVFRAFFDESLASGGALVVEDLATGPPSRAPESGKVDAPGNGRVAESAGHGRVIGSSRYHGYHADRSEVEIGWSFLARRYWGGRYNGEMKRLMLGHAFQFVDRVLFLVGMDNIRSQRAVEKIGGVQVGTRENAYGLESLVYALDRASYEPGHPPKP